IRLAIELQRVDEDGDDDADVFRARAVDQSAMSGVKRAHGRDQPDALALRPRARHGFTDFRCARECCETHADDLTATAARVECSSPGKSPRCTSSIYSWAALTISSPRLAYCFTNRGTKRSNRPNAS